MDFNSTKIFLRLSQRNINIKRNMQRINLYWKLTDAEIGAERIKEAEDLKEIHRLFEIYTDQDDKILADGE